MLTRELLDTYKANQQSIEPIEAAIKQLNLQIAELKARKKPLEENNAEIEEVARQYLELKSIEENRDIKKIEAFGYSVSARISESVKVTNASALPPQYVELTPLKADIKKAIKDSGELIEGAEIEYKVNITIKG
ncbi:MAG: siphovirus Gp157 family protein [Bacteroidales bacterium]